MVPHFLHHALPENVAAFPMDPFISNHCELVRTWRHENQNAIAGGGFFHFEPKESLFGHVHHIAFEFAAVHIHTDLSGCCGFGIPNRCYDPIVIQPANEFLAAHRLTNSNPLRLRRSCPRHH